MWHQRIHRKTTVSVRKGPALIILFIRTPLPASNGFLIQPSLVQHSLATHLSGEGASGGRILLDSDKDPPDARTIPGITRLVLIFLVLLSGQRANRSKGLLVQQSDDPSVLVHVPLIPDLKEEAAATAAGAPLLCPVGPKGTFLEGSGSMPFESLEALKGGEESIIDFLRRSGSLLLTVSVPRGKMVKVSNAL